MQNESKHHPQAGGAPAVYAADERWRADLEIVGADFFRRYRKRLTQPGIVLEIWRDNPKLGLVDVVVRVHAARRILAQGDDWHVLSALRAAMSTQPALPDTTTYPVVSDTDRLSVGLVRLGGWLFAGFCLLSALSAGWLPR